LKNLFIFFQRNSHWALFIILSVLSIVLLVKNNDFQRSKYLAVFREIAGSVFSVSNGIESYMNLKTTNYELLTRIAKLEEETLQYRAQLEILNDSLRSKNIHFSTNSRFQYRVTAARVVNNSVNKEENFITINKGEQDGIKEDMGVVTTNGIVGVVMSVSQRFAVVIPVLNSKYKPICKIKDSEYFGSLVWDGLSSQYSTLTGLPGHAKYNVGDTIVTNSFSAIFPEGVPVGTVESAISGSSGSFMSLKVRLFNNFSALKEVMIIENYFKDEQLNLQKGVSK
jgi:rod shape-determining protein MreC